MKNVLHTGFGLSTWNTSTQPQFHRIMILSTLYLYLCHEDNIFQNQYKFSYSRTIINNNAANPNQEQDNDLVISEAESLRIEGNSLFEVGNYIEAERVYTAAILKCSTDYRLYNNRAQARIKIRKVT